MPADDDFATYLEEHNVPYAFVFTKLDKLKAIEKEDLALQKEKLGDKQTFDVALKKERLYQLLRDDIVKSVKEP